MGRAVGIDLGTTNSVIAVLEGERPEVIYNTEGGRTTPSVVAFRDNNERLVGQLAKRQSVMNPTKTFSSVKRFIGRSFDEVTEEMKLVPYKVVPGTNNTVKFQVDDKGYAPEEISAQVLRKMVDDAAKYLGEKITDAVITVPAGLSCRVAVLIRPLRTSCKNSEYGILFALAPERLSNCLNTVNSTMAMTSHTAILENH